MGHPCHIHGLRSPVPVGGVDAARKEVYIPPVAWQPHTERILVGRGGGIRHGRNVAVSSSRSAALTAPPHCRCHGQVAHHAQRTHLPDADLRPRLHAQGVRLLVIRGTVGHAGGDGMDVLGRRMGRATVHKDRQPRQQHADDRPPQFHEPLFQRVYGRLHSRPVCTGILRRTARQVPLRCHSSGRTHTTHHATARR